MFFVPDDLHRFHRLYLHGLIIIHEPVDDLKNAGLVVFPFLCADRSFDGLCFRPYFSDKAAPIQTLKYKLVETNSIGEDVVTMKETLAKLKKGERGTISALECAAGECRRMTSLGLQEGKEIEIVSRHPWQGPIVIKVGNIDIAIGRGMAQHVIVEH